MTTTKNNVINNYINYGDISSVSECRFVRAKVIGEIPIYHPNGSVSQLAEEMVLETIKYGFKSHPNYHFINDEDTAVSLCLVGKCDAYIRKCAHFVPNIVEPPQT